MKFVERAAFVLGAGLGTRLRGLTAELPKPMVPVCGKPLITFAFDHLLAAGVRRLVVNTHHRPEAYRIAFSEAGSEYCGIPLVFRHEDVLLDTGGGIKNVEDLLGSESFWVHNGDVLADLDLTALSAAHEAGGNLATLGLRLTGGPGQVAFEPETGRVTDIRGVLGKPGKVACVFSGIYLLSPEIFEWLEAGRIESIVTALLRAMEAGRKVGGVLWEEGLWFDLGTIGAYREIHRLFAEGLRLSHTREDISLVDSSAELGPDCRLEGWNAIGKGAKIGGGSFLRNCVIWPGAKTSSRVTLENCIVRNFADHSAESEIL